MADVRHLALVRDTGRVDAGDLTRVAAALQAQVLEDFAPAWRRPASVDAFMKLEDVPTSHWPMIVRDDISYDAQGIHLDNKWGPFSLVRWDAGWSLTASHECLEMLADPYGDRLRSGPSPKQGQGQARFLVEVCDPCEAQQFAYKKNSVVVSDFYLSKYFSAKAAPRTSYSHTGALSKPRQVLQGGYLSWRAPDGHWWQQTWFSGPQPKFVDLGAKPARVSPRRFTDGQTRVPAKFLTPKPRPRAARSGRMSPGKDEKPGPDDKADREARARDLRRRVDDIVEGEPGDEEKEESDRDFVQRRMREDDDKPTP